MLGRGSVRLRVAAVSAVALLPLATGRAATLRANDGSFSPAASADGRYVAFASLASNLVAGDTNRKQDVFVRDTVTGRIVRASVSGGGQQGNGASADPALSADGRYLVFDSFARNLVPGDLNREADVFLRDLRAGTTTRVSTGHDGVEADGQSGLASVSGDGRYVAYESVATNLVSGLSSRVSQVYVWDRDTGRTELVSVARSGRPGDAGSGNAAISADGRFVAFDSAAGDLVDGDVNQSPDVFVRDRWLGVTSLVSRGMLGEPGNTGSFAPSISADGRYIAFETRASNLAGMFAPAFGLPGLGNGSSQVVVRDMLVGTTTVASVSASGALGSADSYGAALSGDGRRVAFSSAAANLVTGDTNGQPDVFVRDLAGLATVLVSVDSSGGQGRQASSDAAIDRVGGRVAFASAASLTPPARANPDGDLFVRDVARARTARIS